MSHAATPASAMDALSALMSDDASIVVLTEHVDPHSPLPSDRVLTLPIADRAMIAVGIGMAMGGRRVVIEVTSSARLWAAAECLAEAVGNARVMPVPLVIRVPYGGEAGDRIDRDAIDALATLDGLRIVCARSARAATSLLNGALAVGGPVLLLEPRRGASLASDTLPAALDRAQIVRAGTHVTVAAWGPSVATALEAAVRSAESGIGVEVVDLVSLSPLDLDCLGESVRRTGRLVVAASADTAFGERVVRAAVEAAFLYFESPPAVANADTDALARAVDAAARY